MVAIILPKLLRLGEYCLNKDEFLLSHAHQRKNSTGRKRRIEYACDECGKVYITKLRDELLRKFPWNCRSCNCRKFWRINEYRDALLAGVTDDVRALRRKNRQKKSIELWSDPERRKEMCEKLRNRNADVYSKARKKMRRSVRIFHWLTHQELICVGSYEVAFVNWCNQNQIDFDWQIPHRMPDNRLYIIDAFIKSGKFTNTWVEIKGFLGKVGEEKWKWFHSNHYNDSQLWNKHRLIELGILNETNKKTSCGESSCI